MTTPFPADAPLWLTIWPNGEAAHYTSLKAVAEAFERCMVPPVRMIVLLEDGRWTDCGDDVIEELDGINHLIASTVQKATVRLIAAALAPFPPAKPERTVCPTCKNGGRPLPCPTCAKPKETK